MEKVEYKMFGLPKGMRVVNVIGKLNVMFDDIVSREVVIITKNETDDVEVRTVVATIMGDKFDEVEKLVDYYKRKYMGGAKDGR